MKWTAGGRREKKHYKRDSNDREYSTLERIMMSVLIKAVKKKEAIQYIQYMGTSLWLNAWSTTTLIFTCLYTLSCV